MGQRFNVFSSHPHLAAEYIKNWFIVDTNFVYYDGHGMRVQDWLNDNITGRWAILDKDKQGWPYRELYLELEEDVVLYKMRWS